MVRGSSEVELATVNRVVECSNHSPGATIEYAYSRRSKYTFRCHAIRNWSARFFDMNEVWIDPFYGQSPFKVAMSNDISDSGRDSHEWLCSFSDNMFHGAFFDPPYSLERVKRSYDGAGIDSWQKKYRNQSGSFPLIKDHLARVIRPGGICLSFGWNSVGLGSGRGFKKEHILLVCHSGATRDTICLMERKIM